MKYIIAKQMLAAGSHIGTMPFKFVFERPGNMFNHSLINDPYLNEKIAEIDANYFNYAKSRQLMREVIPYMLEQAWNIQLPAGPVYQFWQPWLKGYGGELKTGVDHHPDWHKYIWIDRDLREKMTGRR